MTVDECAKRMLDHFVPAMQSRGSPLAEAEKAAIAVMADLRRLLLTESERAAGVIEEEAIRAHKGGDDGSIFHLHNARDEILRTSPGKVGVPPPPTAGVPDELEG